MNHSIMLELLPVIIFFITFKYYGIYTATISGIVASLAQVLIYRYQQQHWDKAQLFALGIFVIFGGLSLYFHSPIFVKWKPTIIFWSFAVVLYLSHAIYGRPLMQNIVERAISAQQHSGSPIKAVPAKIGIILNHSWALFFLLMGAINIYVAYHYSDATWVNFKLYGIIGATIAASIIQTAYLLPYLT